MLILTQGPGDMVVITCPDGTEIRVMVTRVVGSQIHIGYAAPKSYVVDREKIYVRKKRERVLELAAAT